jgi:lysophospholipase L1-like esterase
MRRNVALALASLLVSLVAVELVLRAVSITERIGPHHMGLWQWIRYDAVLPYGNVPGYRFPQLGIAINALGFRGDELSVAKAPGVVRVACLGDSTTFGIWVEKPGDVRANPTYPSEFQRLARGDGLPVEVVNAGILGESSSEGLVLLLTQVLRLEPDVITLRFGNNDHTHTFWPDVTPLATRWEYPVLHAMPAVVWRLETVKLLVHEYRAFVGRHRAPALQRVALATFEENLRRFVSIAGERHVHVVFLDFPYRPIERGPTPGEQFPNTNAVGSLEELHRLHGQYQAVVARVAAETGTPLVRTEDALRAAPVPTFSDYDVTHPNGAGYAIIGQRLYEELRRLGWLDAPTR